MLTGFNCYESDKVASSSEFTKETTVSIKGKQFVDQLSQFINSQGSPCFIYLIELHITRL